MPGRELDRRVRWALAGLSALALALRFWGLTLQSIWVDETFSITWAGIFDGMRIEKITWNLQGPLHGILLFLWSRLFGTGEAALRSFGAIAGAVSVPVLFWALAPLRRPGLALAACALLAVSPFHVWYSQEVRNYVLVILLGIVSTGAMLRWLAPGAARRGAWVLYTAANVLGLLSNLSHSFVLVSQAAWLLARPRACRPLWRRAIASWVITLLLLAPWWAQFYRRQLVPSGALGHAPVERLEEIREGTASTAMGIPYAYFAFATGFSYGPSLRELHAVGRVGAAAVLRGHAAPLALAALAFGLAAALGARRLWREGPETRAWILWAALPVLLTFLVSLRNLKMFNVRYAAGAFVPLLVVLAAGVLAPRRPALRALLAAAVLLPVVLSQVGLRADPRYWKEDARSADASLRAAARPGDLLFLVGTEAPLRDYYWKRNGGPPSGLRVETYWPFFHDRVPFEEQTARFEGWCRDHPRVFALLFRAGDLDREGRWERYLESRGGIARAESWPGVRLFVVSGERP